MENKRVVLLLLLLFLRIIPLGSVKSNVDEKQEGMVFPFMVENFIRKLNLDHDKESKPTHWLYLKSSNAFQKWIWSKTMPCVFILTFWPTIWHEKMKLEATIRKDWLRVRLNIAILLKTKNNKKIIVHARVTIHKTKCTNHGPWIV